MVNCAVECSVVCRKKGPIRKSESVKSIIQCRVHLGVTDLLSMEPLSCLTSPHDHFWSQSCGSGNPISLSPHVVSLSAISSATLMLSSAASLGFCSLRVSASIYYNATVHPLSPHSLHLCAWGSSEAYSWSGPPPPLLLWAKTQQEGGALDPA